MSNKNIKARLKEVEKKKKKGKSALTVSVWCPSAWRLSGSLCLSGLRVAPLSQRFMDLSARDVIDGDLASSILENFTS